MKEIISLTKHSQLNTFLIWTMNDTIHKYESTVTKNELFQIPINSTQLTPFSVYHADNIAKEKKEHYLTALGERLNQIYDKAIQKINELNKIVNR